MDAKTAVEIMRGNWSKLKVRDIHKTYKEIAELIERQEQYAELGRLAMGVYACDCEFGDGDCDGVNNEQECENYNLCHKRAELQKGKGVERDG